MHVLASTAEECDGRWTRVTGSAVSLSPRAGWSVALRTGAALAAAMGVGRFVFTPVLPLMEQQAHLLPAQASILATSNYLGYLLGAVGGILWPWLGRDRLAFVAGGGVLVVSLAAMPLTHQLISWAVIRGVAGVASAVVFIVSSNSIMTRLSESGAHLVGWAYGGVGAGIAASGVLVAVMKAISNWQVTWVAAAALTALLLALAWPIGQRSASPTGAPGPIDDAGRGARNRRWFLALTASYVLEGAGYIVAGTFLVAAVTATGPAWLGSSVWPVVGAAAIASAAGWTWLSKYFSRPALITVALSVQAAGVALPALSATTLAALVSAVVFGATFVGITTLSLATGRQLQVPRAVAILTAGYGVGQVLGPLVIAPTLGGGYRPALLIGAGLVVLAGVSSALLCIHFPHGAESHHHRRSAGRPALDTTST